MSPRIRFETCPYCHGSYMSENAHRCPPGTRTRTIRVRQTTTTTQQQTTSGDTTP